MTLVVMKPEEEWAEGNPITQKIAQWTRERGRSPRLYPAAMVWCCRRSGRDFQDRVEIWLAWQKVKAEIDSGNMGPEFERSEINTVAQQIRNAEQEAVEEAHGSYRFISLQDSKTESGLKTIDLGAGHAGSTETPSNRVINALRREELLNESVGAGYLDRNWPPALQESGAWPLSSLRQSFLNGSLTRLLDPDRVLKQKILEFVEKGDFGLASGQDQQRTFNRLWFKQTLSVDEVTFDSATFLITKDRAEELSAQPSPAPEPEVKPTIQDPRTPYTSPDPEIEPDGPANEKGTLQLKGTVPPESWNMVGRRILTKLQQGNQLKVKVDFSVEIDPGLLPILKSEIQQAIDDFKLEENIIME